MPTSLWPPTSKVEAGSSAGGQEVVGISMITRTTIPGSLVPTLSAPGIQPTIPPQGSTSLPPYTRYYATPDVDPAVFARQIPQGLS